MKSAFLTIGSTAIFSSLITALPTQHHARAASEVAIVIKTGDGDASVGVSVPVGILVATSQPDLSQARAGVTASIVSDSTISCQAFSDAAGNTKLGGVFTTVTTAQFAASSGDVDSVASDAVPIGAFCCVSSKDGFGACSSSSSGESTTTTEGKTVRVQLNGDDELSVQGEVPADNSVFLLASNPPFFTDVSSAAIQDTEGLNGASCQAFSDTIGTKAVGSPITEDGVSLNGGKTTQVVALRCKIA